MPKRSSKDLNQSAFATVQAVTGAQGPFTVVPPAELQKNPAAVALGRLGGLKGGKARANSLTKEQRSDIAKKAAAARWKD